MKMLSIWAIRLAVLKIVPVFLRWLDNAKNALDAGYEAIRLPAIVNGTQKLDEEIFAVMAENIQQRVTAAGRIMDSMLDALEGREDVLPDQWIGMLEDIEEGVSNWEMDAERVVLEGRLREVSKAEEFRTEMEKMELVRESERVAEEAREDEDAVEDVLEKVGEIERGLMEALEAQEDVQEGIEIEGQMDAADDVEPEEPVGLGLDKSLLKRLREVQATEIEADRGRRWSRRSRGDSIGDGFPFTPGRGGFSPISPIASPGLDLERRRSEAENAAEREQKSFFSATFGERLRSPTSSSSNPTIVVQGFDVPLSPRGSPLKLSPKGSRRGSTADRLPIVQEEVEKKPDVVAPILPITTSQQLQHIISEAGEASSPQLKEDTEHASEANVQPSPRTLASELDALDQNSEEEDEEELEGETETFMTPPLGAGELGLGIQPPAVLLKQELPSTPDSTRAASEQGSNEGVTADSREEVEEPIEAELKNEEWFDSRAEPSEATSPYVGGRESDCEEPQDQTPTTASSVQLEPSLSTTVFVVGDIKEEETVPSQEKDVPEETLIPEIGESEIVTAEDSNATEVVGAQKASPAFEWTEPSPVAAGDVEEEDEEDLVPVREITVSEATVELPELETETPEVITAEDDNVMEAENVITQELSNTTPEPIAFELPSVAMENNGDDTSMDVAPQEPVFEPAFVAQDIEQSGTIDIAAPLNESVDDDEKEEIALVAEAAPVVLEVVESVPEEEEEEEEEAVNVASPIESEEVIASMEPVVQSEHDDEEEVPAPAVVEATTLLEPASEPPAVVVAMDLHSEEEEEEKVATPATENIVSNPADVPTAESVLAEEETTASDTTRDVMDHSLEAAYEPTELGPVIEEDEESSTEQTEEATSATMTATQELLSEPIVPEAVVVNETEKITMVEPEMESDIPILSVQEPASPLESVPELTEANTVVAEDIATQPAEAVAQVPDTAPLVVSEVVTPEIAEDRRDEKEENVTPVVALAIAIAEEAAEKSTSVVPKIQPVPEISEKHVLKKIASIEQMAKYPTTATTAKVPEALPSRPTKVSRVQAARMMFENFASKSKSQSASLPRSLSTPELTKAQRSVSGASTPVLTSRSLPMLPTLDGQVDDVKGSSEAAKDPTVLAIEQAIAEIQRATSGRSTPDNAELVADNADGSKKEVAINESSNMIVAPPLIKRRDSEPAPTSKSISLPTLSDSRYAPSTIDLLPSIFEKALDLKDVPSPQALKPAATPHLDDAFEPEEKQSVDRDEDDVISAIERASNYGKPSRDEAMYTLTSSPPKFDQQDSPRLPTPRSVVASSPVTPYHGYAVLNASTPVGDDSFVGFDDFETQPLATSTPVASNRDASIVKELPSISEATTPGSIREEYFGSHDVSFADSSPNKLEKSPMLPDDLVASRSLLPDEFTEGDGSVRYKSTTSPQLARSPIEPFFSSPVPASETSDWIDDTPSNIVLPELDGSHILSPTVGHDEYWNQSPLHQTFGLDSSPADTSDLPSAEQRRFDREETPDFDIPPQPAIRLPKRNVLNSKHQQVLSSVTPDKRQRLYEERPWLENSTRSHQEAEEAPSTPQRNPDEELDQRINDLLMSLPQKVKLTASNLQKLNELSNKKTRAIRPWNTSQSGIPAPKSVVSDRSSGTQGHARTSSRRHNSIQGDIKCYHLHRNDEQPPMKLYVRLVGDSRLVCRVGGGWSDLEEYLKEWATHHGSKMRAVSESRLEIQDIPAYGGSAGQRTIRPSTSNSSLPKFGSPTPAGFPSPSYNSNTSRPGSPACGGRQHRAVSPAFSVTATSSRHSLPGRAPSPAFRRSNSPMLLSHRRSESPALQGPTIPPTLGPSPIMRGGHNGTSQRQPITPTTNSFPIHRQELTPPSPHSPGSRPTSSGSSLGLRRQTSRLSFTESVGDDTRPPLGLAGPRSKANKNMTPENQAWVEGMIGQVRKASNERYRGSGAGGFYSSASERGGSVSGSNYGGSVYGEYEDEQQQDGTPPAGRGRSNSGVMSSPEEARLPLPRVRDRGGETRRCG
ncbi:hypothetical protein K440DRAFT_239482 [Wilcoxina mikolae CBS 423.85]|nr:hypothetical protein K440DRAFT_239482 [Wilcoxina mikolae CBS 423.85]